MSFTKMKAACIVAIILAFYACNPKQAREPEKDDRFNIVFILADDLGWNQVGFHGSDFYETPNIDRIAATGMTFTRAYAAASICSPTRASIMTGKNPARLHITDYIPGSPYPYAKLNTPKMAPYLALEEFTLAEMLKEHGYVTGHFGKWHLNRDKNYEPGREGDPESQGFDVVLTTVKPEPDADPDDDAHHTARITSETIRFIEENKEKPFFAYASYHTVHRPLMENKQLIAKYETKAGVEDSVDNPVIGAMIETLDRGVGRIMEKLDQLDLTQNTIVVFYSDNGGLKLLQSQEPLRGGKAMIFEGGSRVPLAVRWPGVVEPGSSCEVPVISDDFFPTFAEIVNHQALPGDLDGHSLVPLLKQNGKLNREALFWHYPHYHHLGYKPAASVIAGDYKLIEWFELSLSGEDNAFDLYNIATDIGESINLVDLMPEKARELKTRLNNWQTMVNAQKMTLNPDYDPEKANWRFQDQAAD